MDRVEINGRPATASELGGLAFGGYGHFTSMQVRGFRVRGLDLHLERLRRVRPVHVSELATFQAAVLMNSIVPGQPIAGIDGIAFDRDAALLRMVREAYEGNEAQVVG